MTKLQERRVYQVYTREYIIDAYSPVIIGTFGRNLEMRRAVFPLVDKTKIAPASCSRAAPTAAIETVSTVPVGRDVHARSSS